MDSPNPIWTKLAEIKQNHLLEHSLTLTPKERIEFEKDLQSIPFENISAFMKQKKATLIKSDLSFTPPKDIFNIQDQPIALKNKWYNLGLDAIRKGQIACVVMCGGQGTRLGFKHPKGMYKVGLKSQNTLFQYFCRKLLKIQALANAKPGSIPFCFMTSSATHQDTVEYFKSNSYCGLLESQCTFFQQGTMPCFGNDNKILLESRTHYARSPNGNGGIYQALRDSKTLEMFKKSGIKLVHIFSIDNILCRVACPHFIGFTLDKNSNCSVKVVTKTCPEEKVGVLCVNSKNETQVVEYSELDPSQAKLIEEYIDSTNKKATRLVYRAANICQHLFSVDFLFQSAKLPLPFHVAQKKIPFWTKSTGLIHPENNSGYKLEMFIFDNLPFADRCDIFESSRSTEFSAVKNKNGVEKIVSDSPATALSSIWSLHKRWLQDAGHSVPDNIVRVEIAPHVSYGGEGLTTKSFTLDSDSGGIFIQ